MIKWNEYTWYSKTLAAIFFLIIFPIWTFYLGMKYQETKDLVGYTSNLVYPLK